MPLARPQNPSQNSTTSYLTATTLIYAIGAGITAAAGHSFSCTGLNINSHFRLLHRTSGQFVKQHSLTGHSYEGISTFLKPLLLPYLKVCKKNPHLSARYDGYCSCNNSPRDYHRRSVSLKTVPLGFPVPGHLAGIHPSLLWILD